jgi:hypothetical protein
MCGHRVCSGGLDVLLEFREVLDDADRDELVGEPLAEKHDDLLRAGVDDIELLVDTRLPGRLVPLDVEAKLVGARRRQCVLVDGSWFTLLGTRIRHQVEFLVEQRRSVGVDEFERAGEHRVDGVEQVDVAGEPVDEPLAGAGTARERADEGGTARAEQPPAREGTT